jgi:HK97 family phage prohead protease
MIERRVLPTSFEVRATKLTNGQMGVYGYAARYGVLSGKLPSGNTGYFRERIQTGAFDRVLRSNPDVVCLFNHDANYPLGRTTSRTLALNSDEKGLRFACELPNTSYARDLHTSIERGDLSGMSFAFNLGQGDDDWDEEDTDEGRCAVRSILNFSALHDVSVVTNPAYPGTSVDALDARNIVAPVEVRSRLTRKQSKRSRLFASYGNASAEDAIEVLRSVRTEVIETVATQDCRDLMNFILEL